MFCKALKTDTDNELGRFLESFNIVKVKNKLKEACAVQKEKESAIISLSPSNIQHHVTLHCRSQILKQITCQGDFINKCLNSAFKEGQGWYNFPLQLQQHLVL